MKRTSDPPATETTQKDRRVINAKKCTLNVGHDDRRTKSLLNKRRGVMFETMSMTLRFSPEDENGTNVRKAECLRHLASENLGSEFGMEPRTDTVQSSSPSRSLQQRLLTHREEAQQDIIPDSVKAQTFFHFD